MLLHRGSLQRKTAVRKHKTDGIGYYFAFSPTNSNHKARPDHFGRAVDHRRNTRLFAGVGVLDDSAWPADSVSGFRLGASLSPPLAGEVHQMVGRAKGAARSTEQKLVRQIAETAKVSLGKGKVIC